MPNTLLYLIDGRKPVRNQRIIHRALTEEEAAAITACFDGTGSPAGRAAWSKTRTVLDEAMSGQLWFMCACREVVAKPLMYPVRMGRRVLLARSAGRGWHDMDCPFAFMAYERDARFERYVIQPLKGLFIGLTGSPAGTWQSGLYPLRADAEMAGTQPRMGRLLATLMHQAGLTQKVLGGKVRGDINADRFREATKSVFIDSLKQRRLSDWSEFSVGPRSIQELTNRVVERSSQWGLAQPPQGIAFGVVRDVVGGSLIAWNGKESPIHGRIRYFGTGDIPPGPYFAAVNVVKEPRKPPTACGAFLIPIAGGFDTFPLLTVAHRTIHDGLTRIIDEDPRLQASQWRLDAPIVQDVADIDIHPDFVLTALATGDSLAIRITNCGDEAGKGASAMSGHCYDIQWPWRGDQGELRDAMRAMVA